jgi:hypothetical protein
MRGSLEFFFCGKYVHGLYIEESEIFNAECARMRATPMKVTMRQMERKMEKYNILYKYESGE